jgi:acetyl-CoA carboxylase carboxyltransferase component
LQNLHCECDDCAAPLDLEIVGDKSSSQEYGGARLSMDSTAVDAVEECAAESAQCQVLGALDATMQMPSSLADVGDNVTSKTPRTHARSMQNKHPRQRSCSFPFTRFCWFQR